MRLRVRQLRLWPWVFAVGLGIVSAVVASALIACLSALLAGFRTHLFESLPWLFAVTVGPCILGAVALRVACNRARRWSRSIWLTALITAFLAGTLSGSLGAVAVQSFQFSLSSVNTTGYIQWAPVYGVILLPLSFPIAIVLVRIMWGSGQHSGDLAEPKKLIMIRRLLVIVVSAISGMILGLTAGFYAPVLLAVAQGDHAFHVDNYGIWIIRLMVLMPILLGGLFALQAWRERWPKALRAVRWLALLVVCWQVYLMVT